MDSARVELRHAMSSDLSFVISYVTSQEVTRYLTWRPYTTSEAIAAYLQTAIAQRGYPDETLIASFGTESIGTVHILARRNRAALFGFGILPDYWNRGLGGALVSSILSHIRASSWTPHVDRLLIGLHVDNDRAKRLIARHGFALVQSHYEPHRDLFSLVIRGVAT